MCHQAANEVTLNQNNGQMRLFQGTSKVNVFEDDTFYCAVTKSMKFQNYARAHFRFLSPCLPTDSGRWASWSKFHLACFLNSVLEGHSGSVTLARRHGSVSFESGDLTSDNISPGTSVRIWACLWCCFTTSMQVTAHIPCYVLFTFCILMFIYYHY